MSWLLKQFNNEQHLCVTIALTALFRLINHKHIFKWCGGGDVISATTMFLGRSWSTVESSSSAAGVVVFHQLAGDPITHIFRRCSALMGRYGLRYQELFPSLCPSGVYWTLYTLGEKETERGGPGGGRYGEHFIKTDITQHG